MMFAHFFAVAASNLSGTKGESAGTQIFIIVAAGAVLALLTWFARRVAKKEAARTKDMADLRGTVHEISGGLLGEKPTEFNPNPAPGIVKIVRDLVPIVESHTRSLTTLLGAAGTLIADTKPDNGSSSRDVLDEVVTEQKRVRQEMADKDSLDNA